MRLLVVLLLLVPFYALAQELVESQEAAEEVTVEKVELPEPAKSGTIGVIINSENAALYQDLIIPELYPALSEGRIEMDAASKLRFVWRLDDEWATLSRDKREYELSEKGSLLFNGQLPKGYPFGDLLRLEQEEDLVLAAKKVLWNMQALFWNKKIINMGFKLYWLKEDRLVRRFKGTLQRVYPSAIEKAAIGNQFFREKIAFVHPSVVNFYTWLSFRFFEDSEDMLWVYSPAIKKTRQATGSNRSDALMRTPVSLDDFFTWSGKNELVDPVISESRRALVPFVFIDFTNLVPLSPTCNAVYEKQQTVSIPQNTLPWNFESQRFVKKAGWQPSHGVYVPRDLWKIELTPKDPYSFYGRQVLYVDKEMMLPLVKIVYNKAGQHWKTVMSAYSLAVSRDRKEKVPFAVFTIVDDLLAKQSGIIDYFDVYYCNKFSDEIAFANFDPSRIGPPKPTPTPEGAEQGE